MRNDAFCLHHFAKPTSPPLALMMIFFENLPDFLSINEFFSKITPSLFTIKEGSTSFPKPLSPQGTGDVSTALLGAQTASL